MAYQRQFLPTGHKVAKNRKRVMDPNVELKKLRTLSDEDFLTLIGHRHLGEGYKSVHPPHSEIGEPEDAVRALIPPTEGAKAGDRVTTIIMADSVYNPLIGHYLRAWTYHNRLRGVDSGVYSGRVTLEMRERDLEDACRMLFETEICDARRDTIRQYTCTGHSCRLDPQGLMFDAMQRCKVVDGDVIYQKDSFANPVDKPINIGKGLSEEELAEKTVVYRSEVDPMIGGSDSEQLEWCRRVFLQRVQGNVSPDNIKGM
jgi:methyl-coenzyme M reductase gamma subunit